MCKLEEKWGGFERTLEIPVLVERMCVGEVRVNQILFLAPNPPTAILSTETATDELPGII